MSLTTFSIGSDGDLVNQKGPVMVTGREAYRQALTERLRFFQGEWFLNLDTGIPYFQDILIRNPDLSAIKEIYRQAILTSPGVTAVNQLTLSLNNKSRVLTIVFTATTDSGEVPVTVNVSV